MQVHDTVTAQDLSRRAGFLHRAIPVAMAAALVAIAGLSLSGTETAANDEGRRLCNERTLRGDYGLLVTGVRALGPGVTESFIGTALRTYDGHGSFAQVDNSHGQITGANRNVPATGTYQVNADCSGTSMIFFPGAPFPIETAFVIVDRGEEVKDVVMAPLPNLVTAVLSRVGN